MTNEQAAILKAFILARDQYTLHDFHKIFDSEEVVIGSFMEAVLYQEAYNAIYPLSERKAFYSLPILNLKFEGEVLEYMSHHSQFKKLTEDFENASKLFYERKRQVDDNNKRIKEILLRECD